MTNNSKSNSFPYQMQMDNLAQMSKELWGEDVKYKKLKWNLKETTFHSTSIKHSDLVKLKVGDLLVRRFMMRGQDHQGNIITLDYVDWDGKEESLPGFIYGVHDVEVIDAGIKSSLSSPPKIQVCDGAIQCYADINFDSSDFVSDFSLIHSYPNFMFNKFDDAEDGIHKENLRKASEHFMVVDIWKFKSPNLSKYNINRTASHTFLTMDNVVWSTKSGKKFKTTNGNRLTYGSNTVDFYGDDDGTSISNDEWNGSKYNTSVSIVLLAPGGKIFSCIMSEVDFTSRFNEVFKHAKK